LSRQKLRAGFAKYGLEKIGEVGEPFDPSGTAIVQLPSPDVTVNTVADVLEPGYVPRRSAHPTRQGRRERSEA